MFATLRLGRKVKARATNVASRQDGAIASGDLGAFLR